jgi:cell division septal protein FtsQ
MLRKIKKTLSKLGIFKVSAKAGAFLRTILPLFLLIGLTGAGILWVHQSLYAARIMELEKVRIKGLETLTATDILKLADIKKGLNLLDLDLKARVKQVSQDPRIRSVAFKKIFPNRLEIRIQERRAFLQIYEPHEKLFYFIDEEGVLLPGPSHKPQADFMIFSDASLESGSRRFKQGEKYASVHFPEIFQNFEMLENDPLLEEEKIREIRVDELGFWTFVTEDKIEFRIGNSFKNLEKLDNFKILLHSEVRGTLDYLDLRFQDVIVKIKKDQPKERLKRTKK